MSGKRDHKMEMQSQHVLLSPDSNFSLDLDLLIASQEIDVLADREWFIAHPGVSERDRPASVLERAAQGLPPEARVYVMLLSEGRQGRVFYTPEDKEENSQ